MKTFSLNKWAIDSIINLYKAAVDPTADETKILSVENPVTDQSTAVMDSAMQPYRWLAEALAKLFNKPIDEKFLKEFYIFVISNKSKIDKIKNTGGNIQILGMGKDGVAMQLGDFVLKIFLNDSTYQDAIAAQNRLYTEPEVAKTEAMIYEVGTLGNFFHNNLYYYIIEKMILPPDDVKSKLRPLISSIIRNLQNDRAFWTKTKIEFENPQTKQQAVETIKKEVDMIASSTKDSFSETISEIEAMKIVLKPTWISSLIEEIIMKYLTGRSDTNTSNLGLSNGEFRYFDSSAGSFTRADTDTGEKTNYQIKDNLMERDVLSDEAREEATVVTRRR